MTLQGGLIYPAGDVVGLAARLALLVADPERSQRMGQAARRTVCERFTREQMVASWRHILWPKGAMTAGDVNRPVAGGRYG